MSALPSSNTYTSNKKDGELYPVTVSIKNNYGGWTPVECYFDSGNETSIFKKSVADLLGIDLNRCEDMNLCTQMNVGGISAGSGGGFKKFNMAIRIGNLDPIKVPVGFATDDSMLVANLLGNDGVIGSGKYEVRIDEDSVTFIEKQRSFHVSNVDAGPYSLHYYDDSDKYKAPQSTLNNVYSQLYMGLNEDCPFGCLDCNHGVSGSGGSRKKKENYFF
jgi:hypothetical protein